MTPANLQSSSLHSSVLLREAVDLLVTDVDGFYVDCTFGRGGHSAEILSRLSGQGRLMALDRDPEAIRFGRETLGTDPRLELVQAEFSSLPEWVATRGMEGQVCGILADLGVSSPQLDDADRGFSFQRNGPLDMRMSADGPSAADWLNSAEQDEIARVLWEYGEERLSRRIARSIVIKREQAPFETTAQLAEVIRSAYPGYQKKDPATRSFQAIRIHINRELDEIKELLQSSLQLLRPTGRLAVISFHSLEDRLVKRFMRDQASVKALPRDIPQIGSEQDQATPLRRIGKAVRASDAEVRTNPRARSAVLRVAERGVA